MKKIIKNIAAFSMVALSALVMTTGFSSCTDDETTTSTLQAKTKITKAMSAHYFKFTGDFLRVADVSFTYTDSLGVEHTDTIRMKDPNSYAWSYYRRVAYAKVPMTFRYKLTIKMKDKKDIPQKSTYSLGWTDNGSAVAGYDDNYNKVENQELRFNDSPFDIEGAKCKTVTYDALEDAFKNKTDGFENTGTAKVKVTVNPTGINFVK